MENTATNTDRRETMDATTKKTLLDIILNGSQFGDTLADLARTCGCSTQRIASVAKQFDGKAVGLTTGNRARITYHAPQHHVKRNGNGNTLNGGLPAMVQVRMWTPAK